MRDAVLPTEYAEIYCDDCRKSLGRYNKKFYNEDTIVDMLKTTHSVHVKEGHSITIRKLWPDARPGSHASGEE